MCGIALGRCSFFLCASRMTLRALTDLFAPACKVMPEHGFPNHTPLVQRQEQMITRITEYEQVAHQSLRETVRPCLAYAQTHPSTWIAANEVPGEGGSKR